MKVGKEKVKRINYLKQGETYLLKVEGSRTEVEDPGDERRIPFDGVGSLRTWIKCDLSAGGVWLQQLKNHLFCGGKEEIKDPDSFSGQQSRGRRLRYFLLYDFQFPQ